VNALRIALALIEKEMRRGSKQSQTVQNTKAEQFYNFMIMPDNEQYRAWWPEEHLQT
jgi:fibrillarin-like rRNA methylase